VTTAAVQAVPAPIARPRGLNLAAALSMVSGAAFSGLALLNLSLMAWSTSLLSGWSSGGFSASTVSGASASVVVGFVLVILTSTLLFWGALDVALARGRGIAFAGNLLAIGLILLVTFGLDVGLFAMMLAAPAVAILALLTQPVAAYLAAQAPR
jgi:hypothetical protein